MQLPQHKGLTYVLGEPARFAPRPLQPFAPQAMACLAKVSERLMATPNVRAMPDVVSFAYWCRKANLERQVSRFGVASGIRLGRGTVFHVAPGNVPVNFAFSWAFAMLAGNSSILRLPSRDFPQVSTILEAIDAVFSEREHAVFAERHLFVRYGHEQEISAAFSALCDARVIWGGDAAVNAMRAVPLPPRAVEVVFADRTSLGVFDAEAVAALDSEGMRRLVAAFYNDTYLMDQNACSSPRLVVWRGEGEVLRSAQSAFWSALQHEVGARYTLAPVRAVDKLMQACRDAIEIDGVGTLEGEANDLYRLQLTHLDPRIEERRCGSGYFYEFSSCDLVEIAPCITGRYQTLTYFGMDANELALLVKRDMVPGIDRIVPVGLALDIGLAWDGYDLISVLTRHCEVR